MFWDSSALVPLVLPEARSLDLTSLLESDSEPTIWWASPVECLSALYRRHREEPLPSSRLSDAIARLGILASDLDTVAAADRVRDRAGRLLANHPLRAADSLQLAAALIWCEDQPEGEIFV